MSYAPSLIILSYIVEDTLTAALHWMNPSSVSLILPDALHGYTSNPPLSHRLNIDDSGNLVSTGLLQASDAGNVAISSIDYSWNTTFITTDTKYVIMVIHIMISAVCIFQSMAHVRSL